MREDIQKLKEKIDSVAAYSQKDNLISRPAWGDSNFKDAEGDVSSVLRMAQDLSTLPIELLPGSVVTGAGNSMNSILHCLERLDRFSIMEGGDLNHRRQGLINDIHQATDEFIRSIGMWIPYLSYHRGDAEANIKRLNDAVKEVERKGAEHIAKLSVRDKEASDLIENIKSASAEAGVAVYTQDFDNESKLNDSNAKHWLGAAIGFGVATVTSVLVFYFNDLGAGEWVQIVPRLGCRLILITLLMTVTFWCGRMYKTMRNQAILNRHRALGLKTFRAFADATGDVQTKDAVLRETTHAIFSTSSTGLVGEAGGGEPDTSIVQIAGGVLGGASGK